MLEPTSIFEHGWKHPRAIRRPIIVSKRLFKTCTLYKTMQLNKIILLTCNLFNIELTEFVVCNNEQIHSLQQRSVVI